MSAIDRTAVVSEAPPVGRLSAQSGPSEGTRTRRERGLGSQAALNPSESLCRGTRPAPMSGGAAVKAGGGVEGDHPVCTEQRGGRPGTRPAGARTGLALTARGPQAPSSLKKAAVSRAQDSAAGWPMNCARDRNRMAETPSSGGSGSRQARRARSGSAGRGFCASSSAKAVMVG
jgi:hypothetical protein